MRNPLPVSRWSSACASYRFSFGRGRLVQAGRFTSIQSSAPGIGYLGGTVVRPIVAVALAAADAWINRALPSPSCRNPLGEYAAAAEEPVIADEEGEAEDKENVPPEPDQELARLRAQVAALERAAQSIPPHPKENKKLETHLMKHVSLRGIFEGSGLTSRHH